MSMRRKSGIKKVHNHETKTIYNAEIAYHKLRIEHYNTRYNATVSNTVKKENHQIAIKGRGITSNAGSRYLSRHTEAIDDGWFTCTEDNACRPATEIFTDSSKTILTRNSSTDIPFNVPLILTKAASMGEPSIQMEMFKVTQQAIMIV
jgi:hypothetical protein